MGSRLSAGKKQKVFQPGDLYDEIEAWWGQEFNDDLISLMANAPVAHNQDFIESVLLKRRGDLLDSDNLSEVLPGDLRMAIAPNSFEDRETRINDGLRLLLYAHEIVLDIDDLLYPFNYWNILEDRARYAAQLKQFIGIRPLIVDGSIKFTDFEMWQSNPRMIAEEVQDLLEMPEVMAALEPYQAEFDADYNGYYLSNRDLEFGIRALRSAAGMSAMCIFAASGRAQVLARSSFDDAVLRALLQRPLTDGRQTLLHKLAALKVPTMTANTDALVAIRQTDGNFASWRKRLGEAISHVGELQEDEQSLEEASGVVYRELADGLSEVNKAVKKSPTLQAAKNGLTGLSIAGISAVTTGVATAGMNGDVGVGFAAGVAGGVAGKIADSGLAYIKALQERRNGRLIMDAAMLFDTRRDATLDVD